MQLPDQNETNNKNNVITVRPFTSADFLFMDNRKALMAMGYRKDVAERFAAHSTFNGESINFKSPQSGYACREIGQEEEFDQRMAA